MNANMNVSQSLIDAVRNGRLERTRKLINSFGLSYSQEWSEGYVLLCDAVEYGQTAVAKLLLTSGAKVNSKNTNPINTPLHYACTNIDIEIVKMLLDKDANVNVKNEYGRTPLHNAIENKDWGFPQIFQRGDVYDDINCYQIVEHLLNYGADVNCMCTRTWEKGYTPLHLAVKTGNIEVVSLLLSRGANVDVKAEDGITPLHIAAQKGYIDTSIAEDLLKHGACIHSFTLKEGYTPLHIASEIGNKESVTLFLTKGADVNACKNGNLTPLHMATLNGHKIVVKLLLQHGAKTDIKDKNGKTALHIAVEWEYLTIVEDVLRFYPDINDECNKSSLKIAVLGYGKKYKKIVEALLEYGFTVDPEDANNPELLHNAVKKGYLKIIDQLFKYGANVNASHEGSPHLHCAAKYKQAEVAKLLINCGADINAQDGNGKTPIFYSIENADLKMTNLLLTNRASIKDSPDLLKIAVMKERIEIVEALLQHGADINDSDDYGRTALHFTASNNYEGRGINIKPEIAKLLLSKGASIYAKNRNGETTLHVAITNGHVKVVEVLLKYIANVNSEVTNWSYDKTPLHFSADRGNDEISTMLLNKGANVNAKRNDGTTALHIATENGHKEVVKVLLEHGANVDSKMKGGITPLHLGAEKGNKVIIETILKFGANIDSTDEDDRTALHISSEKGHKEVVKVLLERGAKVDSKMKGDLTPLHLSAKKGYQKIIETILKFGADIESTDEYGRTALHIASLEGRKEVVKVLLERGAKVDSKMKGGFTPLHLGAKKGYRVIIETILKFGANIESTDECGRTPLHIAAQKGHKEVVVTLLEYGSDINITCRNNCTPLDYAMARTGLLCSRKVTAEALKRQIVKMKTANLYVSEQNLLSIN